MNYRLAWLSLIVLALPYSSALEAQDTRQFYLSPIDGKGSEEDPFHSRCLDMPGKGNIDLRPWGIARFLCASNSLPSDMTGVQQLGASLTSTLGARKAALNTLAGKTLEATTVDQAIVEILSPKLRAGRDGKIKIYLGGREPIHQQTAWLPFQDGGLVADVTNFVTETLSPAIAWATTVTETFTATNGDLHGCQARGCTHTHTEVVGSRWTVASNQAVATNTATANISRMETPADTVDHSVSITTVSMSTGGGGTQVTCGVLGRKDNTADATYYRYIGLLNNSGEIRSTSLAVVVDGVGTTGLDTDTDDWTDGGALSMEMDGTSIVGKVNGVTKTSATDATLTTGTYGGLRYNSDTATGNCTADNLVVEDIVAASASGGPLRRRAL